MAHYVMESDYSTPGRKIPIVVYLDTGTGLKHQREYVESVCDEYGWMLWTLRTHESYSELVHEYGFPGPSQHGKMYNRLKKRQLERLAARVQDAHYYTGIRGQESQYRMENMSEETVEGNGDWTWHSPLYDWSSEEAWEYIEKHDIPKNSEWRNSGRAADCFCGAYANREELWELEADHPEKAEWIRQLEESVPFTDERGLWGWGDTDDTTLRGEMAKQDPDQMTLCTNCGIAEETQ